jgi:hypothetical protein
VKVVGSSSYLPRAVAAPALPRRAFDPGLAATGGDATGELVLTVPHPTARLPFLAQYLAQEFGAPGGTPTRWRQRDDAYRLAGNPSTPARLTLDI